MPPDDREVSRIVYGLAAKLDAFQSNWQVQDQRASDGRRILYEKFESMQRGVQDLTHKVEGVVTDVAEMKPAVQDWVKSKNWAMGAKAAAIAIGSGAGAVVAAAGWLIEHFLLRGSG